MPSSSAQPSTPRPRKTIASPLSNDPSSPPSTRIAHSSIHDGLGAVTEKGIGSPPPLMTRIVAGSTSLGSMSAPRRSPYPIRYMPGSRRISLAQFSDVVK
jgi:hypothetical protein